MVFLLIISVGKKFLPTGFVLIQDCSIFWRKWQRLKKYKHEREIFHGDKK